jgi:hypothetical protein
MIFFISDVTAVYPLGTKGEYHTSLCQWGVGKSGAVSKLKQFKYLTNLGGNAIHACIDYVY